MRRLAASATTPSWLSPPSPGSPSWIWSRPSAPPPSGGAPARRRASPSEAAFRAASKRQGASPKTFAPRGKCETDWQLAIDDLLPGEEQSGHESYCRGRQRSLHRLTSNRGLQGISGHRRSLASEPLDRLHQSLNVCLESRQFSLHVGS